MKFNEEAETAKAAVAAIEVEIRDLDEREQKFSTDALAARDAAASALSSLGQAQLDEEAESAEAFRTAREENTKRAEELESAISATQSRIQERRVKLAEAKREAEVSARLASLEARLQVVDRIKPPLADVLSALALEPSLFFEIAESFPHAARGSPEYPLRKLEEVAARCRAELEGNVPKPRYIPAGPPPLSDTAIFALAPFSYIESASSTRHVPAGFIGLVPKVAAKKAEAAGVGQVLTPPAELIVVVGRRSIDVRNGDKIRMLASGTEYSIARDLALRFAEEGKLEKIVGPSLADMANYQRATVNRARQALERSFGLIVGEIAADELEIEEVQERATPPKPQSEKQVRRNEQRRLRETAMAIADGFRS